MSEWKEVSLKDITELVIDYRGKTPLKLGGEWSNHGYRALSAKNVKTGIIVAEESIRYVNEDLYKKWMKDEVQKGDILITSEAPFGEVYFWNTDEKIVLSQRLFDVRIKKGVCPQYVYYYMTSYQFQAELRSRASGTTVLGLKQPELLKTKVILPNYETQVKIAGQLSEIDSKIENNRKICANLEAQAQALFKHWFIDFAPFKDGKFVESELGMIPEGWRVGKLSDYVDNLSGYSYKGSELQPSSIAMATIKNFVRGGGFKTEGYKEIVISKVIKDYQYINLFDVLVAHTDLTQNAEVVGNPAIVLSTAGYDKLIMSMDLTKVVSKDKRLTSSLIHSILSTRKFKEHALGYVNGTTVLHMSKKAVPEYTLAMPINLDVLKELTSGLNDLYQMMSETYAENLLLSTLRDTLLPKLMSGEIKV